MQLFTLSAGKFWSNASYPVNIGSSVYVNTRQRPQFDATVCVVRVCVVRTQESSVHFKRLSSREAAEEAQWLYWAEFVVYELPTATPKVITRHCTIDLSTSHRDVGFKVCSVQTPQQQFLDGRRQLGWQINSERKILQINMFGRKYTRINFYRCVIMVFIVSQHYGLSTGLAISIGQ